MRVSCVCLRAYGTDDLSPFVATALPHPPSSNTDGQGEPALCRSMRRIGSRRVRNRRRTLACTGAGGDTLGRRSALGRWRVLSWGTRRCRESHHTTMSPAGLIVGRDAQSTGRSQLRCTRALPRLAVFRRLGRINLNCLQRMCRGRPSRRVYDRIGVFGGSFCPALLDDIFAIVGRSIFLLHCGVERTPP